MRRQNFLEASLSTPSQHCLCLARIGHRKRSISRAVYIEGVGQLVATYIFKRRHDLKYRAAMPGSQIERTKALRAPLQIGLGCEESP